MRLPGLLEVVAPLSWEEKLLLSSGSFRRFLAQGTQPSDTKKALCVCPPHSAVPRLLTQIPVLSRLWLEGRVLCRGWPLGLKWKDRHSPTSLS